MPTISSTNSTFPFCFKSGLFAKLPWMLSTWRTAGNNSRAGKDLHLFQYWDLCPEVTLKVWPGNLSYCNYSYYFGVLCPCEMCHFSGFPCWLTGLDRCFCRHRCCCWQLWSFQLPLKHFPLIHALPEWAYQTWYSSHASCHCYSRVVSVATTNTFQCLLVINIKTLPESRHITN